MSSSQHDGRRRAQRAPAGRRLTRKNSSFLASVKSFVAAPLSRFFSGQEDDFDDAKDDMGKRRRLDGAQNEPAMPTAEPGPPTKKLRRHSPDRLPQPRHSAYLDPPSSAFSPATGFSFTSRLLNVPPPAAGPARPEPRTTLSPLRNQGSSSLSRTMSVDPPQAGPSFRLPRDVSMRSASFRDQSMEPPPGSALLRPSASFARDTSLPRPGSASFRMRTSLTPQPLIREVSEPPTIHSLGSKPVFVRGPSLHDMSLVAPPPTLGDIVQDQRRTQSPIRSHSATSLLFGTQPPAQLKARPVTAAERALQDLEAYKTPLKPTRVRENKSLAAFGGDPTDMFSRRKSYQRMPGARGAEAAKTANKSKPYAGEAGIKKHLARNRLAEQQEAAAVEDNSMVDEEQPTPKPMQDLKLPEDKDEYFKPADKKTSMPSQSSLRVGRTFTSRNHIERPAARAGKSSKFSASFDDDDDDKDDEEARKEREMMEEAAKKVPVFSMPANFSFAKAPPPIQADPTAKEPPISSLPFSIATPSPAPAKKVDSYFPVLPPTPAPEDKPVETPAPAPTSDKSGAIPNFFANSKTLSQTPPAAAPASAFSFAPKPSDAPPAASPFSFGGPPAEKEQEKEKPASAFSFGGPAPAPPKEQVASAQPAFSFGQTPTPAPDAPKPDAQKAAQSLFSNPASTETPSSSGGFSFGQPASTSTSTAPVSVPFSFGAPAASGGGFSFGQLKPASVDEGGEATPKPASSSLFGAPAPAATLEQPAKSSSGSGFTFGQPAAEAPAKSGSGFTFGQPAAAATEAAKPFSFGTPGPAPAKEEPVKPSPSLSFSFGQSQDASASKPFSFGAPTNNASSTPGGGNMFSFGAAPSTPPVSDGAEKKGFAFPPAAPAASSTASSSTPFSFGAPKPFSFGVGSGGGRPVTPPMMGTDGGMEVNMDESPTREVPPASQKIAEPRPTLGGGGFGFGSLGSASGSGGGGFGSASGSGFGSQTQAAAAPPASTTPTFSFGAPAAAANPNPNPFGRSETVKVEEKSGGGFSFGQSAGGGGGGGGFSFGQKAEGAAARPSTAGSFSFSSPNSGTGAGGFAFGGAGNNSTGSGTNTTSGFPQVAAPSSAPSSPSTFHSPAFAFGAGPSTTNPFGFGSQPASPAPGSAVLPPSAFGGGGSASSSGGFGSGGGFGQSQSQANPFAASGPTTPVSAGGGGGGLFTMGAAPAAAPGSRQVKKLPMRRAGAKR